MVCHQKHVENYPSGNGQSTKAEGTGQRGTLWQDSGAGTDKEEQSVHEPLVSKRIPPTWCHLEEA